MCWQSSHHPHAVSMIGTGEHSFSPCRPAGCIRLWRTPTALHGQREQQTYQTFDLAMCGYVLVSPIWHWQSAQHFCTNRRCQLQQLAGITTFTCLTMATGMMYLLYQAGGTRMGAKAGLGLSVSPPVGCRRNVPPLRLAFVSTQQIRSTKRTATERCWHPSARSASTLPQHCVVHFVMRARLVPLVWSPFPSGTHTYTSGCRQVQISWTEDEWRDSVRTRRRRR